MDTSVIKHKASGIYQILNTANQMVYVGSANDMKYRLIHHRNRLRANQHRNAKLQNAWNSYGEATFECSVLEFVEGKAGLVTTEQKWIDRLRAADRGVGYNILPLAYRQIRVRALEACINCNKEAKPLRGGRCHTRHEYLRRRGVDRVYIEDGRIEKSAKHKGVICIACTRPVAAVKGQPIRGQCASCYRVQQKREARVKK